MSKRAVFDFPNTCPRIDRAIDGAKAVIERAIDNFLEEACPLMSAESRREWASRYSDDLYGDLEDVFEETRSTNEDMRRQAEHQIEGLAAELDDAEAEIDSLKRQVNDLESSHA